MSSELWPNLFVVGAAKCGTTSLHDYLSQHPSVFMSVPKEPHFFSRIEPSPELAPFFRHVTSTEKYLALFDTARDFPVRGDASTSYLWSLRAPESIGKVVAEPRFIALLRDPAERAYSHYLNDVREGIEKRPFGQAIEDEMHRREPSRWGVNSLYVELGYYERQLRRYFQAFGADRVLVLIFEDFAADPIGTMARVFRFLGIDQDFAAQLSVEMKNPFRLPRGRLASRIMGSGLARRAAHRFLPAQVRQAGRGALLKSASKPRIEDSLADQLRLHYEPEIAALEELTATRYPWPRSKKLS